MKASKYSLFRNIFTINGLNNTHLQKLKPAVLRSGTSRFDQNQLIQTSLYNNFTMTAAAARALGYKIVTSEESVKEIASYKSDLIKGKAKAGNYLNNKICGLDLSKISIYEFIEILLSTKKPQIFAELHVQCDGTDWSSREFAMLGNINVAVKVLAYDNGVWDAKKATEYDSPLDVELLFTPGAMLNNLHTGVNNPDYNEVVDNGQINQEKYYSLVKRRLLPLFSYVNNETVNEKKALVVLPGIGCGNFAGKFRGQMADKLESAVRFLIESHKFPNIKGIQLGFFLGHGITKNEINGTIYEIRGNGLPQLSRPEEYGEEYKDCKLYKVVAWDHVSLPGNDFFCNNNRSTDDGVSAAATNVMEIITGVKGKYEKGKYFPPKGYADWEDVARSKRVKLIANKDNVKIVSENGQYIEF